ncbi:TPA: GNAT family N-acetyltransferase [Serratia odorifera]|nr:GNAT family N-acetyltransferase [Serratia odorifera]
MAINHYGQPIGEALTDWQAVNRPDALALNGTFCRLVALDAPRDYRGLFDAYQRAADDRDWTYLPAERPDSLQAMLQHLQVLQADPSLVSYTVCDPVSGEPLGTVALMRIDPANGVLEIGHVNWSPAMKQRPSASEAIFLLLRYAFNQLGYRRCEWKCDSLNAPSRRAALRFGFVYEGQFKCAIVIKGRNRDTDWFAITRDRWPTIERGFARWLAADNFTPDGQQKTRLQALFD